MKTVDIPRPTIAPAGRRLEAAPLALACSPKITPAHLDDLSIVYVRQSSPQQMLKNRESTERQYNFAEQAVAFGWPRERVLTIDEDLGKSGRTAEGRSGFQRLVREVTLGHVGMVLGLELSRLARSSKGVRPANDGKATPGGSANKKPGTLAGLVGIRDRRLGLSSARLRRGGAGGLPAVGQQLGQRLGAALARQR